jgi:hypothetical protein
MPWLVIEIVQWLVPTQSFTDMRRMPQLVQIPLSLPLSTYISRLFSTFCEQLGDTSWVGPWCCIIGWSSLPTSCVCMCVVLGFNLGPHTCEAGALPFKTLHQHFLFFSFLLFCFGTGVWTHGLMLATLIDVDQKERHDWLRCSTSHSLVTPLQYWNISPFIHFYCYIGGYIVTFIKVLATYHNWIHPLHHSPLSSSLSTFYWFEVKESWRKCMGNPVFVLIGESSLRSLRWSGH